MPSDLGSCGSRTSDVLPPRKWPNRTPLNSDYYGMSSELSRIRSCRQSSPTTRLSLPVHVVGQVKMLDRISGNRFVSRYACHPGCFDGEEREFRSSRWSSGSTPRSSRRAAIPDDHPSSEDKMLTGKESTGPG